METTLKLEESFTGIGEVKGFEFTKIAETDNGYVYLVKSSEKSEHYEVFKRKKAPVCIDFEKRIFSETDFKEIYPKAKDFGKSAWSFNNLNKAIERLKSLNNVNNE